MSSTVPRETATSPSADRQRRKRSSAFTSLVQVFLPGKGGRDDGVDDQFTFNSPMGGSVAPTPSTIQSSPIHLDPGPPSQGIEFLNRRSARPESTNSSSQESFSSIKRISLESVNITSQQAHSSSTKSYELDVPFIYDSVLVHFDFGVYVAQLFIHLLLPFSFFLSPNPSNQGMIPNSIGAIFYQWLLPLLVLLTVVSYCLALRADNLSETLSDSEDVFPLLHCYVFPLVMMVLHRSMVCPETPI